MPLDPVGDLLTYIAGNGNWPPKGEKRVWDKIERGRAFAENDRGALARIAQWSDDRPYRIDPLADRIREAWADHLFGEELEVTLDNEQDAERLEQIVEENDLTEEARHAVRDYQVPEGEAWWRVYIDLDVADVPLVEFLSRRTIIPLYLGRRLLAAALVSELEGKAGRSDTKATVYRLLEVHENERMVMVLYRGTTTKIGKRIALDEHPETEELVDGLVALDDFAYEWRHDLPMLMGRVPNRRGRNPRLGVGEFEGIEDLLLKLNESLTIGWENLRLTAKRRVVVSAGAVSRPAGPLGGDTLQDDGMGGFTRIPRSASFDAGEDVLVADALDEELGKSPADVFKVLEYSYDAEPLIADKRDTVETALTRIGLSPQWVGTSTSDGGYATSGTHYRLRMIPTDKAGRGRARGWDRLLPRILGLMMQLDAKADSERGLGEVWHDPEVLPTVTRANPIPVDPVEQATTESALLTSGGRSIRQSVIEQHPEWSEEEVDAEVEAIKADRSAAVPGVGF
jgi:hypothetical protein